MPERFHRVHAGGAEGGVNAEEDSPPRAEMAKATAEDHNVTMVFMPAK